MRRSVMAKVVGCGRGEAVALLRGVLGGTTLHATGEACFDLDMLALFVRFMAGLALFVGDGGLDVYKRQGAG